MMDPPFLLAASTELNSLKSKCEVQGARCKVQIANCQLIIPPLGKSVVETDPELEREISRVKAVIGCYGIHRKPE